MDAQESTNKKTACGYAFVDDETGIDLGTVSLSLTGAIARFARANVGQHVKDPALWTDDERLAYYKNTGALRGTICVVEVTVV